MHQHLVLTQGEQDGEKSVSINFDCEQQSSILVQLS